MVWIETESTVLEVEAMWYVLDKRGLVVSGPFATPDAAKADKADLEQSGARELLIEWRGVF